MARRSRAISVPPLHMNPLLLRASLRYLLRHPWQIGLCVLGVALGVAVVVAIDLANASASRAFALSTESVTGRATHQIVGGPSGLPEDLYRQIRVDLGLREAAPVVEGYVRATDLGDLTLRLLGVDPLAEGPFRPYLAGAVGGRAESDLSALLSEPGAVLLAEETAARFGIVPGAAVTLQIGAERRLVRVIGLLRPADDLSRRAIETLLISDIATAQELLGMVGRLSHIDLILSGGAGGPGLDRLAAILPPGAELTTAAARSSALEQMTRAFALNLSALSMLALIVGMFLIYNTVTFSVVQRRPLLGTLRCLGVTRRQVGALVLGEAALVSLLGALLGLGLGVILGRGLVALVTQTINDLYFVVTVRELSLDPAVLLKGFALGVLASLASAAVPAWEATNTPPRTVLRRSSAEDLVRRAVPRAALVGVLLLLVGAGLLVVEPGALAPRPPSALTPNPAPAEGGAVGEGIWGTPAVSGDSTRSLSAAFGGLFALVIGAALIAPAMTVGLMALARPVAGRLFGLLGRMAARDVVASLSRTAVAVAALMVAVSVTIGVGVMVGSFRGTVISWLEQSLVADVYIAPPSNSANRVDTTFDPALADELAALSGVAGATRFRNVQVQTAIGPVTLVATDPANPRGRGALRFRAGGTTEAWEAWEQAGAVFISEPLAYRSGLGVGDSLTLRTDRGPRGFPIVGVYDDYASDRGIIRMHARTYRALWDDRALSSLAIFAAPGQDVDALVERLRAQVAGRADLVIGSNQALRVGTLAVFDRTFAITAVLQLLATIVAFIGILSALMALQLERSRELGVLRANGLTPGQLWGLVLGQTGLLGLSAGLLAIPLGLALATALVYVINRRSFGWTLDLSLEPALFAQALLVALVAALLAGVYPAWRMSRASPAAALREE